MGIGSTVGKKFAPKITDLAPHYTHGFVREALRRAIDGIGPLDSAAEAAGNKLAKAGGNVDEAVDKTILRHVEDAGAQGFATNIGGRSEEHTSELQSLMRISYAVFCLRKKRQKM